MMTLMPRDTLSELSRQCESRRRAPLPPLSLSRRWAAFGGGRARPPSSLPTDILIPSLDEAQCRRSQSRQRIAGCPALQILTLPRRGGRWTTRRSPREAPRQRVEADENAACWCARCPPLSAMGRAMGRETQRPPACAAGGKNVDKSGSQSGHALAADEKPLKRVTSPCL